MILASIGLPLATATTDAIRLGRDHRNEGKVLGPDHASVSAGRKLSPIYWCLIGRFQMGSFVQQPADVIMLAMKVFKEVILALGAAIAAVYAANLIMMTVEVLF
jgi:hypothetical protein